MSTAELTFSLIVNTVDRAGPLATLLRALEHQSYPHFEVIVVVGPTKDNTLDVLAAYADRVRVLHCPTANLSRSRNIGLLAARGEIAAYIDDDAVPSRNWLKQLACLFGNPALSATGGIVYNVHPRSAKIQHRIGLTSSLAEQLDVRASWLDHIVPTREGKWWQGRMMGTNMAFRRPALLAIGGFDEYYSWLFDDADICLRLAAAGYVVQPVTEAAVYHVPASSRNRVVHSFNVRWWVATQAAIYFAVKNGRPAGESVHDIALRCLHIVHGYWLWASDLRHTGGLTLGQSLNIRLREITAGLSGVWAGLFTPRRLLTTPLSKMTSTSSEPIQPFIDSHSAQQPAVEPVSGYRPAISLAEPPLRICLLSKSYPPQEYDGVGRLTNLMARGLFELGHTVHVITGGETERVAFFDGAYVHYMPYQLDRYPEYKRYVNLFHTLNRNHAVYELVKRLKLNDDIQLVDSPLWLYEGLVTALSGLVPVVVRLVTAHRQISALHNEHAIDNHLVGEMEKTLIERATHALPNTQATLDAVQKVYGLNLAPDRYSIVPYGLEPAPDDLVRPFDVARHDDELTVLFVGRLEKRKGIQDLFEAIPQVLKHVPRARFVIVGGDNSYWDGFLKRTGQDYATYFQQHYATAAPYVKFMGSVSDEDLQKLYAACDLFVAPSLYESFGLIYLEAMNYAKPVIGCRAGGIPEVIDHDSTGLVIDPEAPQQLAEAIVSLLKSPQKLREFGLAGREQIRQRFHYLTMARNFAQAYRTAIRAKESA
jgi:glycogen(starch) synthase